MPSTKVELLRNDDEVIFEFPIEKAELMLADNDNFSVAPWSLPEKSKFQFIDGKLKKASKTKTAPTNEE